MSRRVLSLVTLLVVTLAPAVVFSQSLADTAKAEQARRKKAAPAGTPKVYTESDLPASPARTEPEASPAKSGTAASSQKSASPGGAVDARKQAQAEDLKAREAEMKARIAETEVVVQNLSKHPTGGGRVCVIPEGVYKRGETAPSSVVCPYQMETRYEQAKRRLDEMKAALATFQTANHLGTSR